ncbi:MAG: hypothetical protein ABH856_04600 [Patescibacteria group bacterium]|nr:hypothetical protein [Patescibacteria group bacterium]
MRKLIAIITVFTAPILFLTGCTEGAEELSAEKAAEEVSVLVETEIPQLEGAKLFKTEQSDGKKWAEYFMGEPQADVQEKYKTLLEEQEWEIETVGALGGKMVLGAKKEDEHIDILISEVENGSEIEITLSKE